MLLTPLMAMRVRRWLSVVLLCGGLTAASAQTLLVESFDAGSSTGSVVPGSSWEGNVTQNAGSITVGGDALDENGWFAPAVNLDATGMNVLTITAQRDSGNQAPSVAIQFEDPFLNTTVFSIAASEFAVGELTTVHLAISGWAAGFDFTQITGWNFGGGSPGIVPFRLTIDEILFEAEILAAPEITSAGADVTVVEGESTTFAVTATGTDPLTYQWFHDGAAVTGNASATTASLALTDITPADAGNYTCVVSNGEGSATSPAFALTVRPLAVVTLLDLATTYSGEPRVASATTDPAGLTVTFTYDGAETPPTAAGSYTVVATVDDDSYVGSATGTLVVAKRRPVITWDAGGPLNDGDTLTAENLDATADTDGAFVYDPALGTTLATGEHTLTAQFTPTDTANELPVTTTRLLAVGITPPSVLSAPSNQVTILGQASSFTVSAAGPGTLFYEWSKDGAVLPEATSATLTLNAVTLDDAGDYTVRVYSAAGSAPTRTASLTVHDVSVAQSIEGAGYTPGATVTVTNTVTYTANLSALTWSVLPPAAVGGADWAFAASSGDTTATTTPTAGDTDLFEWQWSTVPANPFTFSYTVDVPAAATGDYEFTAMASVTIEGTVIDALVAPDPLTLAAADTTHSADTNGDFAIDLSELLRVIELYNTRFGTTRTGRYQEQSGTDDGFASDPSLAADGPVGLTQFHSADYNDDGLVDLSELLRVIELYNQREGTTRTGRYHVATGTVDGFAPGE
ncbi:MBG domain-containing protein [Actomonas aquatica]|uniref:MBG domain-containing protein n=1 Tax=Actomonas aquatica TaxID=2866162 RepID=A0ABZ1C538_9BACT|nr:MBG domain-containing protein [Opitutus sp. WL0086]WRQ86719.1 MBG domain-containing protein [Opitutus sp. WL0086]